MNTINFDKIKRIDPKAFHEYTILDIGCGNGRHTCEAVRFHGTVAIGVDKQLDHIKETRNKLHFQESFNEVKGTWYLLAADIHNLPFHHETFDMIICSEVLEHIHDDQHAVEELTRVLKKGKFIVTSVPRYFPEKICWMLSPKYANAPGGHVRIYKTKELIDLFRKFELKEWDIEFAHSFHTPYWWLKCISDRFPILTGIVHWYHQGLVWQIMNKNKRLEWLEQLLNPIIGKSVVIYFRYDPC